MPGDNQHFVVMDVGETTRVAFLFNDQSLSVFLLVSFSISRHFGVVTYVLERKVKPFPEVPLRHLPIPFRFWVWYSDSSPWRSHALALHRCDRHARSAPLRDRMQRSAGPPSRGALRRIWTSKRRAEKRSAFRSLPRKTEIALWLTCLLFDRHTHMMASSAAEGQGQMPAM